MAEKNKSIAAILALLVGGLGAHKFYLGDIGKGLLYLLFFWTGIPALIALVFGIKVLMMDEDEFHDKYVADDTAADTPSVDGDAE